MNLKTPGWPYGSNMTFLRFRRQLQKEKNDEMNGQHEHENTLVVYGGNSSQSWAGDLPYIWTMEKLL